MLAKSKKQHPYFDQFQSSRDRNPLVSRPSTPFVTPRVLPRPPAGTTRQRSQSRSSRLTVQPPGGNSQDVAVGSQSLNSRLAIVPATVIEPPSTALPNSSFEPEQPTVPEHPRIPPSTSESNRPASKTVEPVLSPTQQTFEQLTKLDPRALKFQDGDFFVMMELREKWHWDSRKMNTSDWMQAAQRFNEKRQQNGPPKTMIPIQGKVFQEELLRAEKTVSRRLLENNFQCE